MDCNHQISYSFSIPVGKIDKALVTKVFIEHLEITWCYDCGAINVFGKWLRPKSSYEELEKFFSMILDSFRK